MSMILGLHSKKKEKMKREEKVRRERERKD
jgi:hypothetical protein